MKLILLIVAIVGLSGCATVRKVETGVNTVGERFSMHLDGPWNHLDFPSIKPGQVWTMEGITVDELLIYSGIKDGQAMHPEYAASSNKKNIVFRKDMPTEELVAMFESVLTRDDSIFKLKRIEPSAFGGKKGFLFEFERIRKFDNVQQLGFGYGAVDKEELFAMIYLAPALTFFPRHQARVEAMAHTARIKSDGPASAQTGQLPPPAKVLLRSSASSAAVITTSQAAPQAAPAVAR